MYVLGAPVGGFADFLQQRQEPPPSFNGSSPKAMGLVNDWRKIFPNLRRFRGGTLVDPIIADGGIYRSRQQRGGKPGRYDARGKEGVVQERGDGAETTAAKGVSLHRTLRL